MGFEPTVPVRVRRFSRPFRYDRFGISPFNKRYLITIKCGCQYSIFDFYVFFFVVEKSVCDCNDGEIVEKIVCKNEILYEQNVLNVVEM